MFVEYIYLWVPTFSLLLSQLLKPVFYFVGHRKWSWRRLFGSGGMPSGHAAFTTSLATLVGLNRSFSSPEFAISALLAFVVMYDARGVRHASGSHANYLNNLVEDLAENIRNGELFNKLKTEIGHTTLQVAWGFIVGIAVGYGAYFCS